MTKKAAEMLLPADGRPVDGTPTAKNRFMVSFGAKYANVYDAILADAAADDRDPGEYLVRWLALHYSGSPKQ